MSSEDVEVVLIAGPTASGKSALALRIARATGGTIVNADSMQVYRDLAILTARPTPEETALAPHLLFGEVDGAENFSVGRYVERAAVTLQQLSAAGVRPILVGGTGLYFKALTEGLSDIPPVPETVRSEVRARSEDRDSASLHAELAEADPVTAARLRPTDRQRVLRALEIHAATGRPLASFHGQRTRGLLADQRMVRIFLTPDRETLRRHIDARFVAMMDRGALREAAALDARQLDLALPIMRAHGVPGLLAHLHGQIRLEEAIERGQADTRAYAKRQFTWFRHQMPGFAATSSERAYDDIMAKLDGGSG